MEYTHYKYNSQRRILNVRSYSVPTVGFLTRCHTVSGGILNMECGLMLMLAHHTMTASLSVLNGS